MLRYVCTRMCAHTHRHTHVYTRTYTDMYTHTHMYHIHMVIHRCTHMHTQTCTHIHSHAPHTHTLCSNNNKPYKKSMQAFSFPHSPSSSQFVRGVPLCAPNLPVSFQRTPSPYTLRHFLVHYVLRARVFLKLRSLALGSWGGEKLTEQAKLSLLGLKPRQSADPGAYLTYQVDLPPGSLSIP